jgi:hypothetical protein
MAGVLLSAIFQISGARWGRAYRRIAEGSVALMPVGLVGLLALVAGGSAYLPWAHAEHLTGGKHIWLSRGIWDARVLGILLVLYGLSVFYFYLSVRKDFCIEQVRKTLTGPLAAFFSKGLSGDDQKESQRCDSLMSTLSPVVAILYGVGFTILAVDLIMALEPDWFSTLFGAWYFMGQLFTTLALVAILGIVLRSHFKLGRFLTLPVQNDAATLLIAFTLLSVDFFWSQYLTIWYGNLPEETMWLVARTAADAGILHQLSWATLATFFAIPFLALLFRKVKRSGPALTTVAVSVIVGIFGARFIEIAPALMDLGHGAPASATLLPLAASALAVVGFLGAGLMLWFFIMTGVPVMPVGDRIFEDVFDQEGSP